MWDCLATLNRFWGKKNRSVFLLSIFPALYYTCFQVFLGVPECPLCWVLFQTDSSRLVSQSHTQSLLLAGIYLQREGERMVHGMVIPPVCLHKLFPVSRLQNSPYLCVFKYARTVKRRSGARLKTDSETGERRSNALRACEAYALCARETQTLFLFYAKPILRKKNRLFCSLPC